MLIGMQTGYSPKITTLFSEGNVANYYSDNLSAIGAREYFSFTTPFGLPR